VALFVGRIAAACAVDRSAVVDGYGANASAALGEAGLLRAYVMVPANASVNGLVGRLYTSSFQESMQEAASKVFGGSAPTAFRVNVQPKAFEPLSVPTVTSTTATTTGTATMSMTTAATAVQGVAVDLAARRAGLPWLGASAVGALAAALLLAVGLLVAGFLASRKGVRSSFRVEAKFTRCVSRRLPGSDEELDEPEDPIVNTEALTPCDAPRAALPMLLRAARADAQSTPKAGVQPTAARAPACLTTMTWVNPPDSPLRGGQPVRALHL